MTIAVRNIEAVAPRGAAPKAADPSPLIALEADARHEMPTDPATAVTPRDADDRIAPVNSTGHYDYADIERLRRFDFKRTAIERSDDGGFSYRHEPMQPDDRQRVAERIAAIIAGLEAFYTPERRARLVALEREEERADQAFIRAYNRCDRITAKIIGLPATTPREVAIKLKALTYHRGMRTPPADPIKGLIDMRDPKVAVLASMAADLLRIVGRGEAA